MNYHNITHDDMRNGDGLRVVLWVAGCKHRCPGCQNPGTWDPWVGIPFDGQAREELFKELEKTYISGVTFSGGDPLDQWNRGTVYNLASRIKGRFKNKTIWLYTGYTWEEIVLNAHLTAIMKYVDILVDGRYKEALRDANYPWAGSTNQRVIDVPQTLREGRIIQHGSH